MKSARMTDAQIRVFGWKALVRQLGASGALRFAMLTEAGAGNYAESRHELLGTLSVDELLSRMKTHRAHRPRR